MGVDVDYTSLMDIIFLGSDNRAFPDQSLVALFIVSDFQRWIDSYFLNSMY